MKLKLKGKQKVPLTMADLNEDDIAEIINSRNAGEIIIIKHVNDKLMGFPLNAGGYYCDIGVNKSKVRRLKTGEELIVE